MSPQSSNRRHTSGQRRGHQVNATECLATGLMLGVTLVVIGLFFWQQLWP
ncbi:hypothetical protein [Ferrimonas kyonanensis]|nr:hypothetical protein [Ferrimonas kyonanensis]